MNVLYARTSTEEQDNGIEEQVERLQAEAEARGWDAVLEVEQASARTLARRPVLGAVLARLDADGGALVVTKLDRLTRSVADFETIIRRAQKRGWDVVVLDMGGQRLDTTTATGKAFAQMLAVFAEWERGVISERTRAGLAVVKASGKQLGRPTTISAEARDRIVELRRSGSSWRVIAEALEADGVPAAAGSHRWSPTTVRRHYERALSNAI